MRGHAVRTWAAVTGLAAGLVVIPANLGAAHPAPAPRLSTSTAGQQGQWSPLQSWPIVAIHSSLLRNGRILPWDKTVGTTKPSIWDPASGTFTATGTLPTLLFCSGQVQMADGRLLVVGGAVSDQVGTKTAYAYDPTANSWTRLPDMHLARWYPNALRLADGRILVTSGQITPGIWAETPEVYDPATNQWTLLSGVDTSAIHEFEYPYSYVLPDGRVFVYGPRRGNSFYLDVDHGTWIAGPRSPNSGTSVTMYAPGKLLATGNGGRNAPAGTTSAVIDLTAAKPVWKIVAPMTYGRFSHNLTPLADGTVFTVGGSNLVNVKISASNAVLPTELWNPTTRTWSTMAPLADPRMYHSTSVLLPDGTVLSAGGGHLNPDPSYFSAQIFSPPYLFAGPRPTITSVPAASAYGANVDVQTPDGASIAHVSLVSLAAETHTVDMDQRFVSLPFSQSADGVTVTFPANADLAPPGYYMLFILSAAGVPSVAQIIHIG